MQCSHHVSSPRGHGGHNTSSRSGTTNCSVRVGGTCHTQSLVVRAIQLLGFVNVFMTTWHFTKRSHTLTSVSRESPHAEMQPGTSCWPSSASLPVRTALTARWRPGPFAWGRRNRRTGIAPLVFAQGSVGHGRTAGPKCCTPCFLS